MAMTPLAEKLRPQTLKDFVGQKHLVGPNKPVNLAIKLNQLHSMIFWGPPGCGKTTLARIIANSLEAHFVHLSAVSSGKKDVKVVVEDAKSLFGQKRTILFLDEIHRFNKAQQDYLLPFVEDGTLILIGATTENPSFEVIPPLMSRCQVFVLNELSEKELARIVTSGAKELRLKVPKNAQDFLIRFSNGDARQILNLLEVTARLYRRITVENLKNAVHAKLLRYDQAGGEHYK